MLCIVVFCTLINLQYVNCTMSILVASLNYNGNIDVLYDMMTSKIIYEPEPTHTYKNIINVPNINHSLFDLGSSYIVLQCSKWHRCMNHSDIFKHNNCCILQRYRGNTRSTPFTLHNIPYNRMVRITCDELDKWFLNVAQQSIVSSCSQIVEKKYNNS
jgi:hypothetical protein